MIPDEALKYDAVGWVVIPIAIGGKKPLVKWKHITGPDPERTRRYWQWRPDASIAVLCGPSELVVIDVDARDGLKLLPDLPPTATATTGRGTHHVYQDRSRGKLRNTTGRIPVRGEWREAPGIDLRASGGCFIAPPSIHKSGVRYRWDDLRIGIQPAPGWLRPVERPKPRHIEYVGGDCSNQIEAILDVARGAVKGQRNSSLNWAAWRIGELVTQGQLGRIAAFDRLFQAAHAAGLSDGEATATINSGLDYGQGAKP